MKRVARVLLGASIAAVLTVACAAQEIVIPGLDGYAKGAKSTTNVTLDKNMLGLASGMMNGKDRNQSQMKEITSKLNGIYVHTFQYDSDWVYDRKSVTELRKQFAAPVWSSMVSTHNDGKGGDTDIWVHMVNGTMQGMMIVTATPRELTFVQIDGEIRPEDFKNLQGSFGIPGVPGGMPGPHRGDPRQGGRGELNSFPVTPAPMPAPGMTSSVVPAAPAVKPQDPRPALDYSGHPSPPPQ
jgi:hypothetical protein